MGSHTSPPDAPPAASGEEVQRVLDAIRRIVQSLRESSREAEDELGLTGAQLFVLQVIGRHPSLSINEVAAQTHTHQSSASVVVQRLVDRGLLKRERAEHDGRRLELTLTAKGRALLRKTPDLAQARLIRAVAALPDERRRLLAELLSDVVGGMSLEGAPPAMFFEEGPSGSKGSTDV